MTTQPYWTTEALEKEISELEAELAHKRLLLSEAQEQEAVREDELRRRHVVPVITGVEPMKAGWC